MLRDAPDLNPLGDNMLTVVTVPCTTDETRREAVDVICHASDIATVRDALIADLRITATAEYTAAVLAWFDHARNVPGMVTNQDGSVDLWTWHAQSVAA